MRTVQISEYGSADVLHLADAPCPSAGPGTVVIRIAAAGVNPADVKWRAGMFRTMKPISFPHILGYDVAGTIASVGSDVVGLNLRDPVLALLNTLTMGGYAEFAVAEAATVARMPPGLGFAPAAALPTAALAGFQMIEEQLRPAAGQSVLVTGATGAVGRCAMFAARRLGAQVVAAVRPHQVREARNLGAVAVIALGEQDWSGSAFDHVADTIGGDAVASLCRHLAPGGLIRTAATTAICADGLASAPVFFAVRPDGPKLEEIAELVAGGLLTMPVAHRLPLEQAADAHRLVEAGGNRGKTILTILPDRSALQG